MILGMFWCSFGGKNLTLPRKRMAKGKALDTRLHDTEATCMNANIFILSRTQTQIKLQGFSSLSLSEKKLKRLSVLI